ncbi:MAG: hypothetical protein LJU34_08060 [Oscillospiraceae bacterium]|nr:hypothetical protein [Oscillospiraceae bacterium]
MSGIFEEIRREAATETAIATFIETARYFNSSEADIKKLIMEKYNLDEKTADDYLLKKGA